MEYYQELKRQHANLEAHFTATTSEKKLDSAVKVVEKEQGNIHNKASNPAKYAGILSWMLLAWMMNPLKGTMRMNMEIHHKSP